MTTSRINSVSVVTNTDLDSPHKKKNDCTFPPYTDCLYNYDYKENIAHNIALVSPHYNKIYCTLPTHTAPLYNYDNEQGTVCFCFCCS